MLIVLIISRIKIIFLFPLWGIKIKRMRASSLDLLIIIIIFIMIFKSKITIYRNKIKNIVRIQALSVVNLNKKEMLKSVESVLAQRMKVHQLKMASPTGLYALVSAQGPWA